MQDRLIRQLAFLTEIDALQSVVRQSRIADGSRRENSAEHPWHLAMFALILAGARWAKPMKAESLGRLDVDGANAQMKSNDDAPTKAMASLDQVMTDPDRSCRFRHDGPAANGRFDNRLL